MLHELWILWLGQFSHPELATAALVSLIVMLLLAVWGIERAIFAPPAKALPHRLPIGLDSDLRRGHLTTARPWSTKVRVMIFMDHPNFGKSWQTTAERLGWPDHERFSWPKVIDRLHTLTAAALNRPKSDVEIVATQVHDSFVPLERLMQRGVTLTRARVDYGYGVRERLLSDVATLPGVFVHIEDRTLKQQRFRRGDGPPVIESEEKGVDTGIAAEIVRHAAYGHFDVALLLADDTDYLPLLRTMRDHFPQPVISAGFHGETRLRALAWARINFDQAFMLATRGKVADASAATTELKEAAQPLPLPLDTAEPAVVIKPKRTATALKSPAPPLQPEPINRPAAPPKPSAAPVRKPIGFGTIRAQQASPLLQRLTEAQGLADPAALATPTDLDVWNAFPVADQTLHKVGDEHDAIVVFLSKKLIFVRHADHAPPFRGLIKRTSFADPHAPARLGPGSALAVVTIGFNDRGILLARPRDGARDDIPPPLEKGQSLQAASSNSTATPEPVSS